MANGSSDVGAGPARGEWNCYPEEFWGSFHHIVLWIARVFPAAALAAVWLLLSNQTEATSIQKWIIAGIIIVVVFGLNFVLTARLGATRKKSNFHVIVKFFANNDIISQASLLVCNKFQNIGSAPEKPVKSDFDTDEVVPLQNLLPRLYILQRAADGKHGLLRVDKNDLGWVFTCQRGALAYAAILADAVLVVLAAMILVSMFPSSFGVISLLSFAALCVLLIKLLLPPQLKLIVKKREKLHIVDVVWFENNPVTGVHRRWASFGNAQRVFDFCDAVEEFKQLKITKISIDEPIRTARSGAHDHSSLIHCAK